MVARCLHASQLFGPTHTGSLRLSLQCVLVLNVGLLPSLQKFRSALTQYASKSSSREFISEDPHVARCAFASVPTRGGVLEDVLGLEDTF